MFREDLGIFLDAKSFVIGCGRIFEGNKHAHHKFCERRFDREILPQISQTIKSLIQIFTLIRLR